MVLKKRNIINTDVLTEARIFYELLIKEMSVWGYK